MEFSLLPKEIFSMIGQYILDANILVLTATCHRNYQLRYYILFYRKVKLLPISNLKYYHRFT